MYLSGRVIQFSPFFSFAHLTSAALRAAAARCSGVIFIRACFSALRTFGSAIASFMRFRVSAE